MTKISFKTAGRMFPGALCVFGMLGQVVHGGLAITGIEVDDKPRLFQADSGQPSARAQAVRLTTPSRSLRFLFTEDEPTSRLRYKLEGHDDSWRDLSPSAGMKVSVQFFVSGREIIATEDFGDSGTTPGWRGAAETSEFLTRREEIVVPEGATLARIVIYSQLIGRSIGVSGVDGCRVTLRRASDGSEEIHDWTTSPGTDLEQPLGNPENWKREGGRVQMAQLRTRLTPAPHPILVLQDDDPNHYAVWATVRNKLMEVASGDRLTLEWQAAYSIGGCGPGVAEYPGLKPGSYRFRVATARPNGELTGEELSIPINIVPPLHRRWDFWSVVAVLGIAATVLVTRVLVRHRSERRIAEMEQQSALERERARIARDLHDQIGANLARIGMLTDLVDRSLDDPAKARLQLDKVYATAKDVTKQLNAVVWAVDPANDTLESFARYLHGHAEEYLGIAGIRCHFTQTDALPELALVSTIRHHLMMVAKEALHNVASHADAKVVTIGVFLEGRDFVMEIEDDGCGLPGDEEFVPGNGLKNMRSRAEAIKGGCDILPGRQGAGTMIRLTMPIGSR